MVVMKAMAGRAEYLYHILKAMDEAGIENPDRMLNKAIYEVGKTRAKTIGDGYPTPTASLINSYTWT